MTYRNGKTAITSKFGIKLGVSKSDTEFVKCQEFENQVMGKEASSQVNLLQNSLLSQQEEQMRIAVLEQQIHMSTEDFESEKLDWQSLQQQLYKVLKELREAREQITRLETTKRLQELRLSEPSCSNTHEFDEQPSMQDPALYHTSSPKISNLLDESFLECPRCRAKYPTSRHRELLTHIDYCLE